MSSVRSRGDIRLSGVVLGWPGFSVDAFPSRFVGFVAASIHTKTAVGPPEHECNGRLIFKPLKLGFELIAFRFSGLQGQDGTLVVFRMVGLVEVCHYPSRS
ncbi:hypothetical protein EFK07_14970 [Pseudomonas putida]|jgi:hypothetical protein|uniref:Uncharacterized protein n=1 Tax=Pseudomonas putida TaxID=303 RepID=A0A3M8T268_PSEPU|nr:hypothetical protein [Pseudomonas putida]RNF87707.1 hypothetical protein EFK07_14970 [Pseudomonas putida]